MSYEQIVQLIGSVGFPIVCVFVVVFVFYKVILKIESTHKEDLDKITQALDNNTKRISELRDTLNKYVK